MGLAWVQWFMQKRKGAASFCCCSVVAAGLSGARKDAHQISRVSKPVGGSHLFYWSLLLPLLPLNGVRCRGHSIQTLRIPACLSLVRRKPKEIQEKRAARERKERIDARLGPSTMPYGLLPHSSSLLLPQHSVSFLYLYLLHCFCFLLPFLSLQLLPFVLVPGIDHVGVLMDVTQHLHHIEFFRLELLHRAVQVPGLVGWVGGWVGGWAKTWSFLSSTHAWIRGRAQTDKGGGPTLWIISTTQGFGSTALPPTHPPTYLMDTAGGVGRLCVSTLIKHLGLALRRRGTEMARQNSRVLASWWEDQGLRL